VQFDRHACLSVYALLFFFLFFCHHETARLPETLDAVRWCMCCRGSPHQLFVTALSTRRWFSVCYWQSSRRHSLWGALCITVLLVRYDLVTSCDLCFSSLKKLQEERDIKKKPPSRSTRGNVQHSFFFGAAREICAVTTYADVMRHYHWFRSGLNDDQSVTHQQWLTWWNSLNKDLLVYGIKQVFPWFETKECSLW